MAAQTPPDLWNPNLSHKEGEDLNYDTPQPASTAHTEPAVIGQNSGRLLIRSVASAGRFPLKVSAVFSIRSSALISNGTERKNHWLCAFA